MDSETVQQDSTEVKSTNNETNTAAATSKSTNPNNEEQETEDKDDKKSKVVVLFKAVGSAPILKKSKFKISSESSFGEIVQFIRTKLLKLKPSESLVCHLCFLCSSGIVNELF